MKHEEMIKKLEAKDFDSFGDDLFTELQLFPQGYETIEEMVEDQTVIHMVRFLCEDFPNRYEW